MKIEIIPSTSNLPKRDGWVRLTEKDFNHYESFFAKHPYIQPESVDEVYIKGVLEIARYPIIILRHVDWLLKRDGQFIVDYCFTAGSWFGIYRNLEAARYFIALSLGEKYIQTEIIKDTHTHLVYKKQSYVLPQDDSISRWSWGICSNGSNNRQVLRIIEQINALKIPECEIIVCGPAPCENLPKNVKVVSDEPIYIARDVRIPITRKKNLIVNNARYNNVVIIHDRFSIPKTWYERMCEYGNYFDSLLTPVRDVNNLEYHVCDWQNADIYNIDNPINYKLLPPYSIYNEHSFINGGIIICKKQIYERIKQHPALHWGECEDLDFSQRLTRAGYLVHLDINNYVESTTYRMGTAGTYSVWEIKENWKAKLQRKKGYYWQTYTTHKEYCAFSGISLNPISILSAKAWLFRILWTIVKRL